MSYSASQATVALDSAAPLLAWRVHLLRRDRSKLPVLVLTFLIGSGCVWLMFGNPLPVLAALLLMTGSVSEYLFPIRYRLTETGAFMEGGANRLALKWKETRRIIPVRDGILLSPLPAPSRLDAFRGVFLRFAPAGEPGDRASILKILAERVPDLLPEKENGSGGP